MAGGHRTATILMTLCDAWSFVARRCCCSSHRKNGFGKNGRSSTSAVAVFAAAMFDTMRP